MTAALKPAVRIDEKRLAARLKRLSEFTEPGRPWERTAFSDLHLKAREWLKGEMSASGLETNIDAGGNLIGRLHGTSNGLGALASGSHSDTVPAGGRFDGALGVIAALEVASAMRDAGHRLRHPFEVIDFLAEEPNQYGLSCIGSRAMAGELSHEHLDFKAADGTTLGQGIRRMGGDPDRLIAPLRPRGDIAGFVEIHIEQGRVLEGSEEDIGVVTAIVGITRIAVDIGGRADHSGATPMGLRKDALVGASLMIAAFDAQARQDYYAPLVATVGKLEVHPNASNVVPGRVSFVLEVRAGQGQPLTRYHKWAEGTIRTIAEERGLTFRTRIIGRSDPVTMDTDIQLAISDAASASNLKYRSMPSGAGHDAAHVALFAPSGMIFIPCLDGRSHCPEEFSSIDQIVRGAQALVDTIIALDAKN
ncbi:M20 family metallo-hydrolase [Mesorhizobium wenxiniae]|uniref:Zn-dependent hydrolase n=1 Tax=Mesorhizobium wenxiniae TaxID=2014805 RepID=A0A271K8J3_9HYPH|nr:M20 family metallo-hydrolase [Mesorhizobium wenxiniae]PAP92061.1 Zn-dependent hydrolase [Mesorhizobium wenxiniae]